MDDRHQFVQQNSDISNTTKTLRGLAQGGGISSIAFALYINDLHTAINSSELVLFADDSQTCKELSKNNIQADMDALQNDCCNIVKWFACNDLELNASKTELMIHASKKNQALANIQKIYINECEIKCSEQVKSLGLIKDQLLTWKPHIEYVSKKPINHCGS